MNLLLCGDAGVIDGLKITLASITKYNKEPLNVFLLTMDMEYKQKKYHGITKEQVEPIRSFLQGVNKDSQLHLIDVTELFLANVPEVNMSTRFTPMCMLRLLVDQVESIPDKLLYLDTDVIARGDISTIYNTDIEDVEIAGVLDYYGSWFFRRNIFKRDYINSGVLLMNMSLIKQTGLLAKCRERCATKEMFMPDQSALNKLAVYKKKLPRHFNEQRKTRSNTLIRHFTTTFRFFPRVKTVTVKPWELDRLHSVLKTYEYDEIIKEGMNIK